MVQTGHLKACDRHSLLWRNPAWWTLNWPDTRSAAQQRCARARKRLTGRDFVVFLSVDVRFDISVKDVMVWKPSAVQLRNVKQKSCGSYFTAKQILESPLIHQAQPQRFFVFFAPCRSGG